MKKLLVASVLVAGLAGITFATVSATRKKAGEEKKIEKKVEKKKKKECKRTCWFS